MPNPRTPAPSRIGKTLGAILSTPRRGASDADAIDDGAEPVLQREGAGRSAPLPDPVARPTTPAATASDGAAPERSASDSTTDARAPSVEPPPASAPSDAASTLRAVDVEPAEATDDGGGVRRKKRETFLIPEDLAEAMRNAIVHLSGPPLYYTLAEFGEHAIRSYIAQLEREHNAGRPFPPRPRAVRQGRPLR